jgi:hypothetical protein
MSSSPSVSAAASPTVSETAFAKLDDNATCFLDIDYSKPLKQKLNLFRKHKKGGVYSNEIVNFDRWGWTNMCEADEDGYYSETLPLYAGAAQCELCKGSLVGSVDIEYSGGVVTVTYKVFDEFLLEGVHIYVGGPEDGDKLPSINGVYTVAPGQYGCSDDTVNEDYCMVSPSDISYSFQATFEGISTRFYVIAHAVVAGSSEDFSARIDDEC